MADPRVQTVSAPSVLAGTRPPTPAPVSAAGSLGARPQQPGGMGMAQAALAGRGMEIREREADRLEADRAAVRDQNQMILEASHRRNQMLDEANRDRLEQTKLTTMAQVGVAEAQVATEQRRQLQMDKQLKSANAASSLAITGAFSKTMLMRKALLKARVDSETAFKLYELVTKPGGLTDEMLSRRKRIDAVQELYGSTLKGAPEEPEERKEPEVAVAPGEAPAKPAPSGHIRRVHDKMRGKGADRRTDHGAMLEDTFSVLLQRTSPEMFQKVKQALDARDLSGETLRGMSEAERVGLVFILQEANKQLEGTPAGQQVADSLRYLINDPDRKFQVVTAPPGGQASAAQPAANVSVFALADIAMDEKTDTTYGLRRAGELMRHVKQNGGSRVDAAREAFSLLEMLAPLEGPAMLAMARGAGEDDPAVQAYRQSVAAFSETFSRMAARWGPQLGAPAGWAPPGVAPAGGR